MDERESDMNQSKTITGVQDSIGMVADTQKIVTRYSATLYSSGDRSARNLVLTRQTSVQFVAVCSMAMMNNRKETMTMAMIIIIRMTIIMTRIVMMTAMITVTTTLLIMIMLMLVMMKTMFMIMIMTVMAMTR